MSKYNKAKLDKRARNEEYALKFKKSDKEARKSARKLRVKVREDEADKVFWENHEESKTKYTERLATS